MTNVTPEVALEPLRIAAVSERTGMSGHTLRFYEQEGLLPDPVERDGAGHRVFSEDQVQWLLVCSKMRSSGMSSTQVLQSTIAPARIGGNTLSTSARSSSWISNFTVLVAASTPVVLYCGRYSTMPA